MDAMSSEQQEPKMKVSRHFDRYNERRYSKPWGAVITFPDGIKLNYDFRGHYDASAGDVLIEADAGAVVAFGQKDNRGNGTFKKLYLVGPDGALTHVTESEARDHATAPANTEAATSDLAVEREALLARLAEIDALLAQ